MKGKLFVLLFTLSLATSMLYAQEGDVVVVEEYIVADDVLFDIDFNDEPKTGNAFLSYMQGRNKIGVDFTPNIWIYGLPFAADLVYNNSAEWFGFDMHGEMNSIVSGTLSGFEMDGMSLDGALKDITLGFKARPGGFGMKFNYDFVVTPWLAIAFDVGFAFGGFDINVATGFNVKDVAKSIVKSQIQDQLLDGTGYEDLSKLQGDDWKNAVTDNYTDYESLGLDADLASSLQGDIGDPGDYDSFDAFFDAVYDTEAFQDYLKDYASGTSAVSYSGSSSNTTDTLISAALNGELDNVNLTLGINYQFVEHSLGAKFFPGKKAPYGFYLMPKVGFTYIHLDVDVSTDIKKSIYDVSEHLDDINSQHFTSWGLYTSLEMGWQIQIGKKITADWPVDFGLDITLLDIGYYVIPWADSMLAHEMVKSSLSGGGLDEYAWAANMRFAFLPKVAFTVRF